MENRQDILQELRGISPLVADIQPVNPFTVPDGYFSALPATILEKIRIESLLVNASVDTYGVPAGYFDRLAGNILSKIKANLSETRAELDEVAPLLNTISRREVFTAPAGYFEQTDLVAAARNAKKEAKVISMRKANRWIQYMAAAMMTALLITGAFLFTDKNTYLENEKKYERLDISSELNKVSEDELVTYLNNPEHVAAAPATTQLASDAELVDVKNHIQQVSDEELNQYLKENTEPFDTVVSEKDN